MSNPFETLPLWALFVVSVAGAFLAMEAGFRIGRYRSRRAGAEPEPPVVNIVAATLGLLAFFLAFTFGMAESRFETRKALVLEEANAIGTTYLRTDFLPEPQRNGVRQLLREYVNLRLEAMQTGKIKEAIARSEELQNRLWAKAADAGRQHPGSIVTGLFIQSLNDVIDMHAKRLTAGRNRLPRSIWVALCFVALLGMAAVGYHEGLEDRRSVIMALALVLAFAAVMIMIADLDRSREGLLRVSQQPLVDVQQMMAPRP